MSWSKQLSLRQVRVRCFPSFVLAVAVLSPSAFAQITIPAYQGTTVSMTSTGAWSIIVPGPAWRFAGTTGTAVHALVASSGTDKIGAWQELSFGYTASSVARTSSIRAYTDRPLILFSTRYATAGPNTAPFPVVSSYPFLHHLSFTGQFAEPDFTNLVNNSPWAFFDDASNTFIISPADNFMTSEMSLQGDRSIPGAISPQISTLPAGFTHKVALVYGSGINNTFSAWGQALTDIAGKKRPANDYGILLKSLSYWTDNGATYYYNPGGSSYASTLAAVKAEYDAKGVKLGSMQLDSWWYPKGPDNSWSSRSGIWTYTASPALFTPDLATFQSRVKVPLVTHARWIDENSPYRSMYKMSGGVSTDPAYWDSVATYLKASGATTYEQDWLGLNARAEFNLDDPNAFLDNMSAAMSRHGITIQYCMAEPPHFMQSTKYSNVTNIRTSQDRFIPARWTKFFYSSRFASAVGVWPFADVFMSAETGNLIAATLSAGPVGTGDPLGSVSKANLLRAARADGVIVKPDVSATPLDSVFIADERGDDVPMVAAASTDFGNGLGATYLFAYTKGTNRTVNIRPATLGFPGDAYLYDHLKGIGRLIPANDSYTLDLPQTADGAAYFVLVPVGQSGIGFLGDRDNFTMLGRKRISALADVSLSNSQGIDATVDFAVGEVTRTVIGYSPKPVESVAVTGKAGNASWDAATQMFSVHVQPAVPGGSARVRIVPTPTLPKVCLHCKNSPL